MRKKELLKINEELFKRNQDILNANEELKAELERLKNEVKCLIAKNDELNSKLNATATLENSGEKLTANASISKETQLGAQIIGKIVVNSAKYCNELTEKPNSDTKELVNLILGRTEVAKSQIFSLLEESSDLEELKSKAEKIALDTEDYFKSVMAQIS